MPYLKSTYKPKGLHKSMHFATIFNNTIRKVNVRYDKRERIELEDGDFMDVDWKFTLNKSKKLIICLHGLEGSTSSKYMLGMAKHGTARGYDVLGVNFRGCSGEPNRLFKAYHAAAIDDLEEIIKHVLTLKKYTHIYLKGFSLGGNLVMFYMGKNQKIPKEIKAAMAVSSPNYLKACCDKQTKRENLIYAKNFLYTMKRKLKEKQTKFPNLLDVESIKKVKTLTDFDHLYTAKAFGYKDAFDYYDNCSSSFFMKDITTPTLLINAKNDSFLSDKCYPIDKAKTNPHFFFESPDAGGHLGFYYGKGITYNEKRAFEFFNTHS